MGVLLNDCSFSVFVQFLCYNISNYLYISVFKKDCHVINNLKFVKRLLLNCKSNVKERIFDRQDVEM